MPPPPDRGGGVHQIRGEGRGHPGAPDAPDPSRTAGDPRGCPRAAGASGPGGCPGPVPPPSLSRGISGASGPGDAPRPGASTRARDAPTRAAAADATRTPSAVWAASTRARGRRRRRGRPRGRRRCPGSLQARARNRRPGCPPTAIVLEHLQTTPGASGGGLQDRPGSLCGTRTGHPAAPSGGVVSDHSQTERVFAPPGRFFGRGRGGGWVLLRNRSSQFFSGPHAPGIFGPRRDGRHCRPKPRGLATGAPS